jgi:hypothetical protein
MIGFKSSDYGNQEQANKVIEMNGGGLRVKPLDEDTAFERQIRRVHSGKYQQPQS